MNYKQYLFFLLAGALLLLPVASHYAVSWEEVRKKASALMSDERLQNRIPGIIVAFALTGGLYYYLTRKKGGGEAGGTGVNKFPVNLKQFNVYSQFNYGGGGAASCGYQTFLRGMQVMNAKNEHESDEVLQKRLTDSSPIAVYIGENGEWRQSIIEKRKNDVLKKMLHEKFILYLDKNCDSKVKEKYGSEAYEPIIADLSSKKLSGDKANDLYQSALGFLENIVVNIVKNSQEMIQYDFTDDAIYHYLQKSLEEVKNPINEALIEILEKPEMIDECFKLEEMRKEFLSKNFLLNLSLLVDELYSSPDLQEDFRGEWLSDGELEYLWKEHRVNIVPISVNCGFKAIANFELVDNPDFPKDFDEVAFYIDENVKPLLNKKQQMFQLFGLGTMRQTGETTGTRGHWYPLVMYQNREGERNYYIMDSAGNAGRTRDTNAWKIINLIEKAAQTI